jgi:metallo-beta-lactamase class B
MMRRLFVDTRIPRLAYSLIITIYRSVSPMMHTTSAIALALALVAGPLSLRAQAPEAAAPSAPTTNCADAADWNTPHQPFRVYGNTYYVGTHCLSAILVTSRDGHVLIDAGLPETASLVRANVETLGFRIADVKLILNSHAHFDHAGGIAAIQRASGAAVAASPASARVLEAGASGADDPQHGVVPPFPAVRSVRVLADGDTVRVGSLALTAHWTPGHTPGGTTWSWSSCEGERCLELVYADSQTPISADGFSFTNSTTYPAALQDFARGHAVLERLRCDILLTPHPGASSLWERVAAQAGRGAGGAPALVDSEGCRQYAATARKQLARRVAAESGTR